METILQNIIEAKKKRIEEQKKLISLLEMKNQAIETERETKDLHNAISGKSLSIIGEFKQASPSHGAMDNSICLEDRIEQYNNAVDAISVLTEQDYFMGSTEYLMKIRKMTELPILRKDFIIDEYQVYEARAIGADAILLIASVLDDDHFRTLYDLAESLTLDVLCEVHNAEELKRMMELNVRIIGINNRDLRNFTVSLDNTIRLARLVDSNAVIVSESGVTCENDIMTLRGSGVDALLIGTAFMESEDPERLAKEWKNAYDN